MSAAEPDHFRVAIAGSGFSGLGMAIRLKQEGIEDFVVLERADDLGGTWRDNSYPGCQCDVPSHLYSFSFAPNPDWSRTFSRQQEIWDYLRACAEKHRLRPHIRFGHEVLEADWNEHAQRWTLQTSAGTITADVVISGVGGLSDPAIPKLPGIERFRGAIFHSAQWDHDHDLRGERVAVIGTGASAIQLVPRIQRHVEKLHLFQRTPPWIVPHRDRPISAFERRLYRRLPFLQRLVRAAIYWSREWLVLGFARDQRLMKVPEHLARRHLREQVADPELRRKLTPNYRIGCKRILISNDYYPTLSKPNVELVTAGISEVREHSIVAQDGSERTIDTLICATGFHVTDMPIGARIRGRDGRSLDEVWEGSPQAYLGATITGFPNLFMLTGPNTGLGHTSIVFMIESQITYVMDCLNAMERHQLGAIDVRRDVQDAFNADIQRQMRNTVWTSGGCASWYIDPTGRNSTLWPGFTFDYRQRTRRLRLADYATVPREPVAATATAPVAEPA